MNVSRFGNSKQCWSSPAVQKTYIVMATPHHCGGGGVAVGGGAAGRAASPESPGRVAPCGTTGGRPRLAARYDDPYGAVVDYSPEMEGRILKAIGECTLIFYTHESLLMYVPWRKKKSK